MRYLLVDGNGVAHWQYWRAPMKKDLGGHEVGMLLAVQAWIDETVRRFKADQVLVAIDGPTNWRSSVLPSYKMHRPPTPPALRDQLKRLPAALTFKCVTVDGKEGDDVIADYVRAANGASEIIVASGDKDLKQLVNDEHGVSVYGPLKRKLYREADVVEEFGVPPYRLAEWLALVGDSSDGVPGVPGWGKKYAAEGVSASVDKQHLVELACAGKLPVSTRLQRTLASMIPHFERSYQLTNLRG